MQYRIDADFHVLHLDLQRVLSAQTALERSLVLLTARPDLWGWDWIVDSPVVPEGASVEQVARLAEIYGALPRATATSAIVSHDPNLHLWARVMDFQFPGRRHVVVLDVGAATRLIAAHKAKRNMNRK